MSAQNEAQLVEALQSGEEQAFADLIVQYGGAMLAIARRYMRNEDDARESFQDACLQIFKSIGKFEQRSSLKTWVHRIVVNECLMKLRKMRRGQSQEVDLEIIEPHYNDYGFRVEPHLDLGESAEELLVSNENRKFVIGAINKLPDDFRNVLLLRDIEEYSTQETANLIGISEALVKTRLHRARTALKQYLEPLYRGAN